MDKRMLHDEFSNFENDLKQMMLRLSEMKTSLDTVIEENVRLEVENRHLRERLLQLEREQVELTDEKHGLSKSRMNLENIYEEGFHVCNIYYGTRRENDEECAFCLDVIYGERK